MNRVGFVGLFLLQVTAPALGAQLRPLDALDWVGLDAETGAVSVGTSSFSGQRASLAGTEGRLYQLGQYAAVAHLGRVSIQVNGTALRVFYDRSVFAAPVGGALPDNDARRLDTGDHQLHTLVRLTSLDGPSDVVLRFGVRLPTTDNRRGLERDQTDFVLTIGGRYDRGAWSTTGEVGVGVHGTRDSKIEQVDPLLYSFGAAYRYRWASGLVQVLGQYDTRAGSDLRGTENLSELRFGVEAGQTPFVRVTAFRGLATFSPDFGISVATGVRF